MKIYHHSDNIQIHRDDSTNDKTITIAEKL